MLACDCDYYPEAGDVMWTHPDDYSTLDTSKRKKCSSCKKIIDIGSIVTKFTRVKIPDSDIEIRIYGEDGEIPRAPHFMCEECSDIFYSLSELGFCIGGSMQEALQEYQGMKKAGQI